VEHSAKNQKSAKKQICGFFHFPEKSQKIPKTGLFFIFGAGAPVVGQRLFSHGPQKRVTDWCKLVIVYFSARLSVPLGKLDKIGAGAPVVVRRRFCLCCSRRL
jgi:hypothetical protein